ncbi:MULTISPECIES: hypothetical protein [Parafrankia]|uniref:Uncharacterized protein n=1 Tax=Parafrankia soli TaxID=2599596 RepID=A0A1S1PLJ5_9ACTN|nr:MULTISPECIES: hypothetical protein [Parafrankia]OHV23768.1 hypothetical protein BBK14_24090 [Parafrankia soli]TCJ34495.1 hypothetical protein E0504_32645 [Parafrankia sp. BMG5.11]CAI7978284.1 conserved hypothetical protein [Frankia sp. Hr75.2]SQD98717.1 conserved hypothetical protein [Parafrankia sp. Ea1.12]
MHVPLTSGAALTRAGLPPAHQAPGGAGGAAPVARDASPDHATVLLDLLSDLLTNLVGLAFVLYMTVGLLGVLLALALRARRGASRPGPGAAT